MLMFILNKSSSRHFVPAANFAEKNIAIRFTFLTEITCCVTDTVISSFILGIGKMHHDTNKPIIINGHNYGIPRNGITDGMNFLQGVLYGIYYIGSLTLLSSCFRMGRRIAMNKWTLWKNKNDL